MEDNFEFDIIKVCENDKLCRYINTQLDIMKNNIYYPEICERYNVSIQTILNSIEKQKPSYWDFLNNKFKKLKELINGDKYSQIYNIEMPEYTVEII